MQNRIAILVFAVAFALVSLYHLSFTWVSNMIEKDASEYAFNGADELAASLSEETGISEQYYLDSIIESREKVYLDSMKSEKVFLWTYTYNDVKERELNLGLDLKGGMNATLEVSLEDLVIASANDKQNEELLKAVANAKEAQRFSQDDFITLFVAEFRLLGDGDLEEQNIKLVKLFRTMDTEDAAATVDDVITNLRAEAEDAFSRSYEILQNRIDRFGVSQPNIQRLGSTGRIMVELPGVKDPERVRSLMEQRANLEFWLTYDNSTSEELNNYLEDVNEVLVDLNYVVNANADVAVEGNQEADDYTINEDTNAVENADLASNDSLPTEQADTTVNTANEEIISEFYYIFQRVVAEENGQRVLASGPAIAYIQGKDTARLNFLLSLPEIRKITPPTLKLLYSYKPIDEDGKIYQVFALNKSNSEVIDGQYVAPLAGDKVIDARQDFSQNGQNEISMTMNKEGAKVWKNLTGANIGTAVAIVLDDYVVSAPTVNSEIPNGRSSISGQFTIEEAKDISNILKVGKMPVPIHTIGTTIVGPEMGQHAARAGLISMIIAFLAVLLYMGIYYGRSGLVADIALVANIFFMFGVLASLQAVLTLPGITGIILTLGMAVDANVIIFERIKEEMRAGKGPRLAISDGYKNAYSAIIDGNVTTLLIGVVLIIFGSGPIKGFATTLIIGIITSLFSSIFLSRIVFTTLLKKNKKITFDNKFNRNWFANSTFDFIKNRKKMYIVSAALILVGAASMLTRGLEQGIDFTGGRNFVVSFDKEVNTQELSEALTLEFDGETPQVKTYGSSSQVKITTKWMIDDDSQSTDSITKVKVYNAVNDFYAEDVTLANFMNTGDGEDINKKVGIQEFSRVGPTIADDIKKKGVYSLLIAMVIIFLYIVARFRKWQFALGGIVALIHDSFLVISLYSIFNGILPFTLELDQAFVAAILTIIGYSINDSVVIFDRIRENMNLHPKRKLKENINIALNSTLGRTFNTSGTTFVVLLVIFVLGGDSIKGFVFAMMIGILIGTYSSLFNASPIAYDFMKKKYAQAEVEAAKKPQKKSGKKK